MKKIYDKIATALLWVSGIIILFILLWFLFRIFKSGLSALSWHFITSRPSEMMPGGGVAPEIFNTIYILVLALILSTPIGIGAGIYLAEFSRDSWFTKLIRLCVECLASVPSIVFGLFGMIIFVSKLHLGFSILGGAATLALLNLPVIVRVTEEAIRTVPQSHREASYALGATHWQTIRKIILPQATAGIITGINLVAGRAIGESAVLIYTAGTSVSRNMIELNSLTAGETLSVHLWYVKSVGLVPDAEKVASGTAVVLIIVILLFNILMKLSSAYIKRKFEGNTAKKSVA